MMKPAKKTTKKTLNCKESPMKLKSPQKIKQSSPKKQNQINDHIDLQNIEELQLRQMDPQIYNYELLYQDDLLFHLTFCEDQEDRQENLRLRISQRQDPVLKKLQEFKIELMSDIDIFFHQVINIDEFKFKVIREEQKLNLLFFQAPQRIISTLNDSKESEKKIKNVLFFKNNGLVQFNIEQLVEFRKVVLLTFETEPLNEEEQRRQVMFKYNVYKLREKKLDEQTINKYQELNQRNKFLENGLKLQIK